MWNFTINLRKFGEKVENYLEFFGKIWKKWSGNGGKFGNIWNYLEIFDTKLRINFQAEDLQDRQKEGWAGGSREHKSTGSPES